MCVLDNDPHTLTQRRGFQPLNQGLFRAVTIGSCYPVFAFANPYKIKKSRFQCGRACNAFLIIFFQRDNLSKSVCIPSTAERRRGFIAAKVHTYCCKLNFRRIVYDIAFRVICKISVYNALCRHPASTDKSVIKYRSCIFFFHMDRKHAIFNDIILMVNICVAIQKLFYPMVRIVRVTSTVKVGMTAAQTAFQHGKHIFAPGCNLVAISVLNACPLYPCHMLFIVCSKHIYFFPKHLNCVIASYLSYKLRPQIAHGFYDIAFQRSARIPEQYQKALASAC